MAATGRHFDSPRCKAANRWCSVDAHFQNGAVTMSISLLPVKATNTSVTCSSDQVTFRLHHLQDQKSWLPGWHSFLGCGSDNATSYFAYTASQYIDHGLMSFPSPWIVQDWRPKIVDASLTLILRMGQPACRLPFNLLGRPMISLWEDVTVQAFDCWSCKTKNCWCSVDTHL